MRYYSCTRFYIAIWLIACYNSGALAVNHTIGSPDPRIKYSSPGDWRDQDNGGHSVSVTNVASAVFSFTGSAIYWLSSHDWNGASATISVDGAESTTVDQALGTTKDEPDVKNAVLFSQRGLDGTKEHTISVTWAGDGSLGGGYLSIYGFIYNDDPGVTAPISSPNAVQAGPSTTSTSTRTTVSTSISSTTKTESSTATTSATTSATISVSSSQLTSTSASGQSIEFNGIATQNITATRSVTIAQSGLSIIGTAISSSASTIVSSTAGPTTSGSPLDSTAGNADPAPSGRVHLNMGVLIGVVVSIVAALVLGALLLLCFIRRRRRNLATGSLKHVEAEGSPLPGNPVQSLLPRDMVQQDLPPSHGAVPAVQPHDEASVYGYGTSSAPLRGASKIAAAARARLLADSNARMSTRGFSDIAPPSYSERP